jgi:hypothetical protein
MGTKLDRLGGSLVVGTRKRLDRARGGSLVVPV